MAAQEWAVSFAVSEEVASRSLEVESA